MKGVAAHANVTKISQGPVVTAAVRTVLILQIQRIPANAGSRNTITNNCEENCNENFNKRALCTSYAA